MTLILTETISADAREIGVTGIVADEIGPGYRFRLDDEMLEVAQFAARHFVPGDDRSVGHLNRNRWRVRREQQGTEAVGHEADTDILAAAEAFATSADETPPGPFAPSGSSLDAILTASAGQDVADALAGANNPSADNVFATMADVGGGGIYGLTRAIVTFAETAGENVSLAITAADSGSGTFTVAGDQTQDFGGQGLVFRVTGSTGNDGTYTVASAAFDTDHTNIATNEGFADDTADGDISFGRYIGEVAMPAGSLPVGFVFPDGVAFDADTAQLVIGDGVSPNAFTGGNGHSVIPGVDLLPVDVVSPTFAGGGLFLVTFLGASADLSIPSTAELWDYPAGDTISVRLYTTGDGGTSGRLRVSLFGFGVPAGTSAAVKS